MSRLEARIRSFYPAVGEPEIHVVCSSRPAPHLCIKHSYHLVVSNLIFANNHDGQMRKLFIVPPEDDDALFWTPADTMAKKSIIDLSIYTRNRCIRMPLCTKRVGGSKPFARIGGLGADCCALENADCCLLRLLITADIQHIDVPSVIGVSVPVEAKGKASGGSKRPKLAFRLEANEVGLWLLYCYAVAQAVD